MSNTVRAVLRIVYRMCLKVYFCMFRVLLRLFFSPFRILSYFGSLRNLLDYIFQTSIKEIIAKEFDKSIPPLRAWNNHPTPLLTAVDLGARGGPIDAIQNNRNYFDRIILCEGEPDEALKLKEQGYEVIDKFVGGEVGRGKFYHVETSPSASSLKKPSTKFLEIYGGAKFYRQHLEYQETDIEVTDLPMELDRLNIDQVELLKLDIQGSEYEVLSSLLATSFRPLVIQCEVMQVPFYFDTRYGCEIDTMLLNAHYICIRRSDEHFRGGLPMWCDQLYIPNLMQKEGCKITENRIDEFLLLSRIFRFDGLAEFLLETSATADAGNLQKAVKRSRKRWWTSC